MAIRIHHIALELIFEASLPPEPLIDSSLSYGPESTWSERLRTQKALTLVCHNWHEVAVALLYHDIVLRRVNQIPALLRTLRLNPNLRDLIKHITFACYVPEAWDDVTSRSITLLIGLCPNLRSINFSMPFSEWLSAVRNSDGLMVFNPCLAFGRCAPSITQFTYYDHPLYANIANIVPYEVLSLFPNLTKLELITYPSHDHFVDRRLFNLQFNHLKELSVRPRQGPIQRDYYEVLKTWELPRLEFLAADFCMQPPRCGQYEHHIAFFEKFGPQLRRLNIGAAFSPMANRTHQADDLSKMTPQSVFFRSCPNLEHAIIALCDVENVERYPKRQYVLSDEFTAALDIWVPSSYFVREAVQDPEDESKTTYRYTHTLGERYSRRNIRLIDQALAIYPDIPIHYGPDSVEEGDKSTYMHRVYGLTFSQSRNLIIREEESWYEGMSSYRERHGGAVTPAESDVSSGSDSSEDLEFLQDDISTIAIQEKGKERAFSYDFSTPTERSISLSEPDSESESSSDEDFSPRHADFEYNSDDDSDLDSDFTWCTGDWEIHQQVVDSNGESDDDMGTSGLPGFIIRKGNVKQVTESEALEIHSRVVEQSKQ